MDILIGCENMGDKESGKCRSNIPHCWFKAYLEYIIITPKEVTNKV